MGNLLMMGHAGFLSHEDTVSNLTMFAQDVLPPTPTSGAYSVVVDKKNNFVWVSLQQTDMIARFDPKTEEWVEFPLPEAESDPRRIEIDPTNPNRIYFAGNIPGRMGFVEFLPQ